MDIEVTPEAIEVLRRSLTLGSTNPDVHGVRLRIATALGGGRDVQVELAAGPEGDEVELDAGGIRLFVDPAITRLYPRPIVTVEPQHEIVVVRPGDPG